MVMICTLNFFCFCCPSVATGQENLSPPCSPDLTLDRSFRDLKENKEPSPKVKRRRSVKISSVTLEPTQWQSDALQILTCTNDYRSMNDFLMKKVRRAPEKHAGFVVCSDANTAVLSLSSRSATWTRRTARRTPWWTWCSKRL